MSIAVLNEVYNETRRLAVAGSAVAPGDFRLKKLIPPLEQAGAKAPVFAKVAECIKGVVESTEATSAPALLELTSLISAVLFTQGETGFAGQLEAIETTDLGTTAQQTSARVLKPLLEALSTTGSGRLELIKDAFERSSFKDLRLVKASITAIDDPYPEIADIIATKVLPLYGRAILPELKAKFDLKGKVGHARRLRLMHALDPYGTRETVEKALEAGSKEVKVVAIECLGSGAKDIEFLVEQSSAKAHDVRSAAFVALARLEDKNAVMALQKAMTAKDVSSVVPALTASRHPAVLKSLIAEVESRLASLKAAKEKKEISHTVEQLLLLLDCFEHRDDKASESIVRKLFDQRDELVKYKGDSQSGADLNRIVIRVMMHGSKPLQTALAEAHTVLRSGDLAPAFHAARLVWPMDRVFKEYSGYLTTNVTDKKKQKDAYVNREAVIRDICGHNYGFLLNDETLPPLDPRWLDVAVDLEHIEMVAELGRPGHAKQNAFLKKDFDLAINGKKLKLKDCELIVQAMIKVEHPDAVDAFIAAVEKEDKKVWYALWTYERLIPDLPVSAIPKLEAMVAKFGEKDADRWLDRIQQLRDKHKPAT